MGKNYYFLGIGGISMSALAIFLQKEGKKVAGSDPKEDQVTELLKQHNICVDKKINKRAIKAADVVVCSSAIRQDNPQFVYAKHLGKKILTRGQLLGEIAEQYENVIAVAGSHGKTTTTAMIYEILKLFGVQPTLHLGGLRVENGKNYHIGENDFFVTEACEYHDNFLNLFPTISVITNVEKEHMDYFKTFENQQKSFEQFKEQSRNVVEFDKDYVAKNIRHNQQGNLSFTLFHKKNKIMRLHLQICENINTQNCIYAYRVARLLKIPDDIIKRGLENFKGVKTRFERTQNKDFENIVFDYAHHPTEIKNAIESAKKIYKGKKIVVVFQPHTFSRTKSLLTEFVSLFAKQENVICFKTYSAREKASDGVSAKELVNILQKQTKAQYADNVSQLLHLLKTYNRNDVLLFVGAGDLPNILHKKHFVS